MSGAEHATEAASNLKGMQKYLNSQTITGRRNVSILVNGRNVKSSTRKIPVPQSKILTFWP